MDMDMGMDSGPSSFLQTNKAIARYYWYAVAAVVGCFAMLRIFTHLKIQYGIYRWRRNPSCIPSRPQKGNVVSNVFATLTALLREVIYPQPLWLSGTFTKHFSPPPVGRVLFILCYWALILIALWKDAILTPDSPLYAYYWEKVAFRAAWVSVTQLPMVYCLSCKHNVISWITGISYERLNWMHRWSAITLFFTAIIHWSWFYNEWSLGDIVDMEISMMSMVRYGFAAWGVLGWMIITSFGYFRQLGYELFVIQHILGAFILLWLVHTHVPSYASYNVWMAVAFVVLDWATRGIVFVLRNLRLKRAGFRAITTELPGGIIEVQVTGVRFKWLAGQHIHLYMPGIRLFENHPFTIANTPEAQPDQGNTMRLVAKAHSGFTKSLLASTRKENRPIYHRALLMGPFGNPPNLDYYDTVILIATGTGASFTTPILEDLISRAGPVRRLEFHWIVPSTSAAKCYETQLLAAIRKNTGRDCMLCITIHVTRQLPDEALSETASEHKSYASSELGNFRQLPADIEELPLTMEQLDEPNFPISLKTDDTQQFVCEKVATQPQTRPRILVGRRPAPSEMILRGLEMARGETAVVVCGTSSVVAQVRTYISYISDERGVQKGSGAQGIFLHSERYDW